jgi:hypothetical protein
MLGHGLVQHCPLLVSKIVDCWECRRRSVNVVSMDVTLFFDSQETLLFGILPLIDRIVPTTVQRKCRVATLSLLVGIFVPFPTTIDSFDYLDLARCGRLVAVGKESHVNVVLLFVFRGSFMLHSHSPLSIVALLLYVLLLVILCSITKMGSRARFVGRGLATSTITVTVQLLLLLIIIQLLLLVITYKCYSNPPDYRMLIKSCQLDFTRGLILRVVVASGVA